VLQLTFEVGADDDLALVQTQNRVQLAMPLLPPVVQRQGVSVKKRSPDILMTVDLFSTDGRYDDVFMSNYATVHLRDELLRCPGVGDILLLGQRDYSLRIWLDPEQLASRGLTSQDAHDAIAAQNVQVLGGVSGQSPTADGQQLQLAVAATGLLSTPEEFGAIVLRADPTVPGTPLVRLRDVARIELGAASYDQTCRYNGRLVVGLAVFQLPDANALETSWAVQAKMAYIRAASAATCALARRNGPSYMPPCRANAAATTTPGKTRYFRWALRDTSATTNVPPAAAY
jgi:multidrug efflux pump